MKIAASIFKTLFLCLCIIANTHLAYAQTASILPQGKTQFLDNNGKPLTSGTVDFYIPSTTTRKTTWQNSAETIANANPVVLDAGGRAIIYGDGSYRQVVKDRNGNTIWDQVTSSTGSGSSSPTATGDGDLVGTIKPWAGMTAPNQYAFTYGQEVSRTTYATLLTAITSTQGTFCTSGSPVLSGLSDTTNFWVGMSLENSCTAAGFTTIVSKTSSTVTMAANANVTTNVNTVFFPWGRGNGTTTFNIPDLRGYVLAGNGNMGGVPSNVLVSPYFASPNSVGASGGGSSQTIFNTNLPPYTPTGAITNGDITSTFTGTNTGLNFNVSGSGNFNSGSFASQTVAGTIISTQAPSTFFGTPAGGTSAPFSIIQPTKTTNYIIKVTPDSNSATASGVTSIQSMTGDIACGPNVSCTGNIIDVNSSSLNSNNVVYPTPYLNGISQTQTNYNNQRLSVLDFGAKGDTKKIFDGAITSGTNSFSSASANFVLADVGKVIRILGAGAAGGILETTISAYVNSTTVSLTLAASTTVSSASSFYGTDDTTHIQAAVNTFAINASLRAFGCLLIPNRIFITTSSLTVNAFTNMCIEGAGSSIVSDSLGSIIQPSVNSDGITILSDDPFVIKDVGINYVAHAVSNTAAIRFNPASGHLNQGSVIRFNKIYNAYDGIVLNRTVLAGVDGNNIVEFTGSAVVQQNDVNSSGLIGDAGDVRISNNQLFGSSTNVPATCVYWTGGGGLTFTGNKCSLANIGFQINPAVNTNTSQINIANNSFDGMGQYGVFFSRQDGTSLINQIIVNGNTCNLFTAVATSCYASPVDPNGVGLTNLIVTNNTVYGSSIASTVFNINSTNNTIISNNSIQSNNSSSVGINIGSTVVNATVGAQSFTGLFANDFVNASATYKVGNAITPNVGGIAYSTADRLAVLAGTATASQMLQSGASAAPTWSTATWPATTTINQLLYSTSANTVAGLTAANNGTLITSAGGVPSISSTLPTAVQGNITSTGTVTSGVWNGTAIDLSHGGTNNSITASNGGVVWSDTSKLNLLSGTATASLPLLSGANVTPSWATISYPTSATSGGMPYFSSATAISSSALLAANSIMIGGGAGTAPSTAGCTISATNSLVCTSSSAFAPAMNVTNTTSDANAAQIQVSKSRSVSNTLTNDALGYFVFQGYANSGYRSTAVLQVTQSGASSGSIVPSKMQISTSNSAALQNQQFTFDQNAHMAVTLQATAPTVSGGCNGAGSSITGAGGVANDTHGTIVGQTAAATTCTVLFGTAYANAPDCVFSGFQSPITVINSVGTASFQITFASTANYKFSYICRGI